MSEEQGKYITERAKTENAALRKYAAIQKASEDKIGCQSIYVDITGDLEAALILDEIIFFTLPRENGKSALRVWKDGYLWIAVSRADWWKRKRLTARQADTAIAKLEAQNLIFKSVHKFNGLTTPHLRLNSVEFFKRYGEELDKANPAEDQTDTITHDINDLYAMMGELQNRELQNCDSQNSEGELQNGETVLQNCNSFNIPDSSSTQPEHDDLQEITKSANKKVDSYLLLMNSPGLKTEARIDAILSYLGGTLRINTETKRWKEFAKFVDNRQREYGEKVDRFVSWLVSQKDFNIAYWSPQRMQEYYPQAFAKEEVIEYTRLL